MSAVRALTKIKDRNVIVVMNKGIKRRIFLKEEKKKVETNCVVTIIKAWGKENLGEYLSRVIVDTIPRSLNHPQAN